ncbi:alpha/beta hydrolase [Rhodoferax saidenbachensis]|uniref:alpha/beta hydrolase n=1 Tax=Rhodoferax saidenbachensis TaxID=1484693 RepID=UPI0004BAC59A|nr:alpha/beta hydrolase [Rhodoferax saidenbachensis]
MWRWAASAGVVFVLAQPAFATTLRERIQERRAKAQDAAEQSPRVLRDVPYGTHPKQRMDIYLPANPSETSAAPVIFMVHGGGWRVGDKNAASVVQNKIARWSPRGFVFISINNRLLPDADPLEQARDVARALATAQQQASTWGADPGKFILMGHSAGAHLVALLAASPTLARESGAAPWLGTVALDSAALDVAPIMQAKHFNLYDPAFGIDPAYWRAVSPLQVLDGSARPVLTVCSSRREDSCAQARGFVAKATSLGVRAQVLSQDLSHGDINQLLGKPGAYTEAVEAFMASLSAPVASRLDSSKP